MNRSSIRLLARAIAAVAAALALAVPASASASTLNLSNRVATYTGGAAEANHLTISFDREHSVYVFQDTGASGISAPYPGDSSGCHGYSSTIAYCTYGSLSSITVRLGGQDGFSQSLLSLTPVTMYGGSGNDTLIGGGAHDVLIAGAGSDTLTAGTGDTRLVGGSGTTIMNGGSGHDTFEGGSGADQIHSRDGAAESIACSSGADFVDADVADAVATDCEAVDRGTGAPPPAPPAGSSPAPAIGGTAPVLADPFAPVVASPTVAARQPSRVPIVLACPANAAQGCDGSIELTLPASRPGRGKVVAARRSHRILGRSRRFRIAAGRTSAVPVVLSRRGVRIFRRARKRRRALKVTASVAYRSEAGLRRSSRTVTVRAARRRPNTRGNRIARR